MLSLLLSLADGERLPLGEREADALALGESEALGDKLLLADFDSLLDSEADGDKLPEGLCEALGLWLADGLKLLEELALADDDGEIEALGDWEAEGERDLLSLAEALADPPAAFISIAIPPPFAPAEASKVASTEVSFVALYSVPYWVFTAEGLARIVKPDPTVIEPEPESLAKHP